MADDKRTAEQGSADELHEQLNAEQRITLSELELLGWTLKLVRRPLFQDPVPVVVSDDGNEIGLLDPDGKIIIDKFQHFPRDDEAATMGLSVEAVEEAGELNVEEAGELNVEEVVIATQPNWMEKRKGESPIPDNLEDYLNAEQIKALRQIENFGWELKFVRRPLFQEPIAVIINTDGDRVGTLEPDGRIDLKQNFELRSDATDPDDDDTKSPVTKKKQTG